MSETRPQEILSIVLGSSQLMKDSGGDAFKHIILLQED